MNYSQVEEGVVEDDLMEEVELKIEEAFIDFQFESQNEIIFERRYKFYHQT